MDALIGATGFVGSNLALQHRFSALFNSKNIECSAGCEFKNLVCAGAPGSMFEANRTPDEDRSRVVALMASLDAICANRICLISTVAVLEDFGCGADELSNKFEQKVPYGVHRRMLEEHCIRRFPNSLVIRLPALFGSGLRKNFLFDILNPLPTYASDAIIQKWGQLLAPEVAEELASLYVPQPRLGVRRLERAQLRRKGWSTEAGVILRAHGLCSLQFTNPHSTFQFFPIRRLWSAIAAAIEARVNVLHLATEPITAADLAESAFGLKRWECNAPVHREDLRTRFSSLMGSSGSYIMGRHEVLSEIRAWSASEDTTK
jgi:hypothetical protein